MIQCKAKWPDVPTSGSPVIDRSASILQMGTLVVRGGIHLRWLWQFVCDGAQGFLSAFSLGIGLQASVHLPFQLTSVLHWPTDLRPSSFPAYICAGGLRGRREAGEILVSLRSSDLCLLLHSTQCISDTGLPIFTMYFKITSNLLATSMFALLFSFPLSLASSDLDVAQTQELGR